MLGSLFVWNIVIWTALFSMVLVLYTHSRRVNRGVPDEGDVNFSLLYVLYAVGRRVGRSVMRRAVTFFVPYIARVWMYGFRAVRRLRGYVVRQFMRLVGFIEGRGIIKREGTVSLYVTSLTYTLKERGTLSRRRADQYMD